MNWHALLWWRPPCLLRRVVMNVHGDDSAFEGVLWSYRGAWVTLKNVRVIQAQSEPQAMDGDMVIHRDRVVFFQVLS